jgi:hypothetical protein
MKRSKHSRERSEHLYRYLGIGLLLMTVGCQSKPDLTCRTIHEPKTGCPNGYVRDKKPIFTERDGSKQYACRSDDVRKEGCIDMLKAGESEEVDVFLSEKP